MEPTGAPVTLSPAVPPPRLVIVGAARIAQALAPMAQLAGLAVVVVDPRPGFATPERFPGVEVAAEPPETALARIRLDRRSALVSLAHDPQLDDPAIGAALRSGAFYVGCLGGKSTQAGLRERLRAQGFEEPALERVHGPVGLPLGAATPGEIAVSILAELVGCFRKLEPAAPGGASVLGPKT
ncbi:MAG TPA: XdhC family protein [Anaeromyxobacteraceae bacterium]|nr:XdhC family protein [Anaeromyxobacteraceae bacterium]